MGKECGLCRHAVGPFGPRTGGHSRQRATATGCGAARRPSSANAAEGHSTAGGAWPRRRGHCTRAVVGGRKHEPEFANCRIHVWVRQEQRMLEGWECTRRTCSQLGLRHGQKPRQHDARALQLRRRADGHKLRQAASRQRPDLYAAAGQRREGCRVRAQCSSLRACERHHQVRRARCRGHIVHLRLLLLLLLQLQSS